MTDLGRYRKSKVGGGRGIMARRAHEPTPGSEDDFVTRIQLALDMRPLQLANALEIPWRELVDRQGPRSQMSSFVVDPFWQKLLEYVDTRLAGLMAVKDELERKRRIDVRKYEERQALIRNRP